MRWNDYILTKGTKLNEGFWKDYLRKGNRNVLYILGIGFDPRTLHGIQTIFNSGGEGLRDAILIRYYQSDDEQSKEPVEPVSTHQQAVVDLINAKNGSHRFAHLTVRSTEDKSIASIKAYQVIETLENLSNYTDVIVDISAMPRAIFIPLLNKLLQLIDSNNSPESAILNLHVVVSENFVLDSKIEDDGTEQSAEYIHGLSIRDVANTVDFKEIWIAVLGEKQMAQFAKIKESVKPVSTCIVLPFPSSNLRRGDDLLVYYKDKLLNDDDFDFNNLIYADEQNPFQVYRLIKSAIERYNESFRLLGGCKIVVSALSSKLLTVGAFLAVYETKNLVNKLEYKKLKIGIKHVESIKHKFDQNSAEIEGIINDSQLFHLWIAGLPYCNIKNAEEETK